MAALGSYGGCDWFDGPVEANLPPETSIAPETRLEVCPELRTDIVAGGDVTIAWSGSDGDGDVARFEWTYDDTVHGETTDLFYLIEDVAEGDHSFRVAAVDDDGDQDATPATCSFTAGPAGNLIDRVVLVEFLTSWFCTNCWKGELALERIIEDYGEENISVIAWHFDDDPLVPADPVANGASNDRCRYYYEVQGFPYAVFPTAVFDGDRFVLGAEDTTVVKGIYEFEIELREELGSPVSVDVTGSVDDVSVKVKVMDALGGSNNVARIVLIEDNIPVVSPPYMFVARDVFEQTLSVAAVGDSVVIEHDFDLDPAWNVDNLGVIAFVQNDSTKDVLQSGRLMHE